jgi:hypothetical protein
MSRNVPGCALVERHRLSRHQARFGSRRLALCNRVFSGSAHFAGSQGTIAGFRQWNVA